MAEANAEHAGKPVDTGNRRLPPDIPASEGVARVSALYTKDYEDGPMKGQTFFRASAIVVYPVIFKGEKTAGMVTSRMVPLCDTPERKDENGKVVKELVLFKQNWYEFQNIFKLIGVDAPTGPQYDLTGDPVRDAVNGQNIEAYYFAAMRAMTEPERMKKNPIFISFSTRGWTPPASQRNPKPDTMVFETWHGLADMSKFNGKPDPAAGVTVPTAPPTANQPPQMATAPPATTGPAPQPGGGADPADVVAALVEAAMADPDGHTEDGFAAAKELQQMAWAQGWSQEQTKGAEDWVQVGDMALTPATETTAQQASAPAVTVGSRWMYAKRDSAGNKLRDGKGNEFPAQEVEVLAVDGDTCALKATKDGKTIMDLRTKKPAVVKFGWLEVAPAY